MTAYRPLAATHPLMSLALAALVTSAVLTSLAAEADIPPAGALALGSSVQLACVSGPAPTAAPAAARTADRG